PAQRIAITSELTNVVYVLALPSVRPKASSDHCAGCPGGALRNAPTTSITTGNANSSTAMTTSGSMLRGVVNAPLLGCRRIFITRGPPHSSLSLGLTQGVPSICAKGARQREQKCLTSPRAKSHRDQDVHNGFMSKGLTTPPPPDRIESVDHALRVLSMLDDHSELRVSMVADELGDARSTAHRLLVTLAWRHFLVQDRVTRAFRAGTALIELGLRSISEFDLRRFAEPHMKTLAEQLGETVNIIVLDGANAKFIGGVEGPKVVRTRVATGLVLPAYATSGGKVLLASLPPETIRELYPRGLKKVTAQTRKT